MQPSDGKILKERLEQLADALGAKCPSGKGLQVWYEVLKGFYIADVISALDKWATEKVKFPAPAEIAKVCSEFLSIRVERKAVLDKAEFAEGATRILGNPEIARIHLAKIWRILKPTDADLELQREREAMIAQDMPI
jgi:hypothetical protein